MSRRDCRPADSKFKGLHSSLLSLLCLLIETSEPQPGAAPHSRQESFLHVSKLAVEAVVPLVEKGARGDGRLGVLTIRRSCLATIVPSDC